MGLEHRPDGERGKRVAVPKKTRFEVFKRDRFTCRYCGRKAPDVVLHIEHVQAVKHGGTNSIINLLTACADCNFGKGAEPLEESAALVKQHAQMAELEERREQQRMMIEWQAELENLHGEAVHAVAEQWETRVGLPLSETGLEDLRKLLRNFSVAEVLAAFRTACDQHLQIVNGAATNESAEKVFTQTERIARFNRFAERDPAGAKLRYIREIVRNRFNYINEALALSLLGDAHERGVTLDALTAAAKRERNWTAWKAAMGDLIGRADADERVFRGEVISAAPALATPLVDESSDDGYDDTPGGRDWTRAKEALLSLIKDLRAYDVWQLVGYAKGSRLLALAEPGEEEPTEEEERLRRSVKFKLEEYGEASGFGDALGLVRSNWRADILEGQGEIDSAFVWEAVTDDLDHLPREPYIFYASDGSTERVMRPCPDPKAEGLHPSDVPPTGRVQ